MHTNTIDLLRFLRQGGSLDELFQNTCEEVTQSIEEDLHATTEHLHADQRSLEERVNAAVARATAGDVTGDALREAERLRARLQTVQAVQAGLQADVELKKEEVQQKLKANETRAAELTQLRETERQRPPSSTEQTLKDLGRIAVLKAYHGPTIHRGKR